MNITELKEWMKSARCVDHLEDRDKCENNWETRIYEKDGEFFKIEFLNGYALERREYYTVEPTSRFDDGTRCRNFPDEYDAPKKVYRKTRIIEEFYYETNP